MPKLLNSVSTLYTNLQQDCPFPLLNHNSQVYFPWDPLFALPLQSCFQGSLAIGVGWWRPDVLSLFRSQQQQDIMPENFMLSWLDMVMTLPVMKVVILCHPCTKKTPIYTIFGVITVFPKLTNTKPLPRSGFSCRTDQTSKTLVPTSNESIYVNLKQKKHVCIRMFHLAIFHIFLEPFLVSLYHHPLQLSHHHLPPKGHRTLEFYKTFLQDLAFAYREQHTVVGWPAFKNLGKVKVWWVNILWWYSRQMMSNMMLEDKFQWFI